MRGGEGNKKSVTLGSGFVWPTLLRSGVKDLRKRPYKDYQHFGGSLCEVPEEFRGE